MSTDTTRPHRVPPRAAPLARGGRSRYAALTDTTRRRQKISYSIPETLSIRVIYMGSRSPFLPPTQASAHGGKGCTVTTADLARGWETSKRFGPWNTDVDGAEVSTTEQAESVWVKLRSAYASEAMALAAHSCAQVWGLVGTQTPISKTRKMVRSGFPSRNQRVKRGHLTGSRARAAALCFSSMTLQVCSPA